MRKEILSKLKTDISALTYSGTVNLLFNSVQTYYKGDFSSNDCILTTDGVNENITGNSSTYRDYGFLLAYIEEMETSTTDAQALIMVDRMSNKEDVILNYIQKEPNSLTSLISNNIEVVSMRVDGVSEDDTLTTSGYAKIKRVRFTVKVNIVPQLL